MESGAAAEYERRLGKHAAVVRMIWEVTEPFHPIPHLWVFVQGTDAALACWPWTSRCRAWS